MARLLFVVINQSINPSIINQKCFIPITSPHMIITVADISIDIMIKAVLISNMATQNGVPR